jgi:curved DNA-binding protein CbpA
MRAAQQTDPFTVLGLPARAGLSDDEVRAAWRRIAAATHPDRTDGGDAARFAAAAAAYTALRTNFGRAESLADLARPAGSGRGRAGAGRGAGARAGGRQPPAVPGAAGGRPPMGRDGVGGRPPVYGPAGGGPGCGAAVRPGSRCGSPPPRQ